MSERNPFIICKASAGSGKTFTLVLEYLRFALAGDESYIDVKDDDRKVPNFARILAITFTNKAANEMKTRIMETVAELAVPGTCPKHAGMAEPLLKAINQTEYHRQRPLSREGLSRRAALLRSSMLHRYSDLSVCTIDSFMHRVVRTFAHDLGRPVNFEVRIEQEDLIKQAVSNLMSLVGTEGHDDLTRAVTAFAISRMENEKSFAIDGSLADLAKQLFKEDTDRYLSLLREYTLSDFIDIYRRYVDENHRFEQQLQSLGTQALDLLASVGMGMEDCAGASKGYFAYFARLASGDRKPPTATVAKVFEAADYCGATLCRAKGSRQADTIAQPLRQAYLDTLRLLGTKERLGEPLVDYNTRSALLANLYSVALLGELGRCLQQYSADNEVVHLSEFNKLINSVVMEQDAPFFYERLGSRYSHFLIDEFQDTSVLQWQNLVPLLSNGVSENKDSLVVGDAKQAIYRFRQGDVRQFLRLPEVEGMPNHSRVLSRAQQKPLDTNYRTRSAVVEFNNRFFSDLVRQRFADHPLAVSTYIGGPLEGKPEDDSLHQEVSPKNKALPAGCVDITFTDPKDKEAVLARVLEIITDLVQNQGYHYRDIMVLARSGKNLEMIGNYLKQNSNVPQQSAESFRLRGSHAVLALIAALRCLADMADNVAAADLLIRLQRMGILRDNHLDAFADREGFDLRAVLRAEGIDFNRDNLLSLDLYNLCEQLVRIFRLEGIDVPYVASLLNRVAAFSARHIQGISDFLTWFDEHPDLSAACSDEEDAIRLLTIHKAKGLEAPVVICAFLGTRVYSCERWVNVEQRFHPDGKSLPAAYLSSLKKNSTRFDPDYDEDYTASLFDDLNILYVAFTRPRERLYAVCLGTGGQTTPFCGMVADGLRDTQGNLQTHYQFGDPTTPPAKREDEDEAPIDVHLSRLSFHEWSSLIRVASPSERALTPLLPEPVRFGIYAHELLADIEHADDVDAAIARFLKRQPTGISDSDLQRLQELAREVVVHPLTARFFRPDYQIKTECAIIDGDEECRPDRVVVTPDETWVVDFKTGYDQGDPHTKQVLGYCRTLAAMGFPKVSGYLLYFEPTISLRLVPAL